MKLYRDVFGLTATSFSLVRNGHSSPYYNYTILAVNRTVASSLGHQSDIVSPCLGVILKDHSGVSPNLIATIGPKIS